jgi:hypothetical protein
MNSGETLEDFKAPKILIFTAASDFVKVSDQISGCTSFSLATSPLSDLQVVSRVLSTDEHERSYKLSVPGSLVGVHVKTPRCPEKLATNLPANDGFCESAGDSPIHSRLSLNGFACESVVWLFFEALDIGSDGFFVVLHPEKQVVRKISESAGKKKMDRNLDIHVSQFIWNLREIKQLIQIYKKYG